MRHLVFQSLWNTEIDENENQENQSENGHLVKSQQGIF
jgi:hypothetical protein